MSSSPQMSVRLGFINTGMLYFLHCSTIFSIHSRLGMTLSFLLPVSAPTMIHSGMYDFSLSSPKVKVIQSEYEASVSKYEAEQASYAEYADMETTPIDDLMAKANETEKMKGHINEWRRMLNIQKEVDELQSESNSLTEKIELARTLPGTILETAEIPIEGLTVKDGIPLINGLPVSNLSEGEKLDLCIDVAIQNPSGLQIILIDGTEKLSEENRTRLYEKCKKKGLQFIATRTTSNNELTVIEL